MVVRPIGDAGRAVARADRDGAAGFGGVEVAYVYPLGPVTTEFMSEAFLADLRFAADRAHELGLRFDLTLGSGWSFGGPHISDELAARRLHWERREISPGPLTIPVTSPWPGDQLVAAYVGAGSIQEQPESYQQLSMVNGMIMIPDGHGTRQVLLGYAQRTGQNVKRAAVGSEGPVLDHYSAAAVDAHLLSVGDRMLDAVPAELVGSVFCDSLEVYDADWTAALPQEFERRRGYPLMPVLYRLAVDGPDAAGVRADYHHTLAELYQENFVAVASWAGGRPFGYRATGRLRPRSAATGSPTSSRAKGGWKEITQTRWASSAAHLYGRNVVSAEVWTWVHSPSFRATRSISKARHTSTSSTASTSSSGTAGLTLRPTRRGWAGSSTHPLRSTIATCGGRRCRNSTGTCAGCVGCCARASRWPMSRCTCPTRTCSRPWAGRRADRWTPGGRQLGGSPARSRRRSGRLGWTTT